MRQKDNADGLLQILRRRELIALLGSAVFGLPQTAWSQQPQGTIRHVGVLIGFGISADDPPTRRALEPLHRVLQNAGWIDGKNVHLAYRFGRGELAAIRIAALELVALNPDVIYAITTPAVEAVYHETKTIPIVFSQVADPIGEGWVKSFAHPGGNVTGFVAAEGPVAGKYIQLLREVAPAISSVGMLFNPKTMPYAPPFIAAAKHAAGVAVNIVTCEVASEQGIDRSLAMLAGDGHGALVVMPDPFLGPRVSHIIAESARLRLPAIYGLSDGRAQVKSGGLMSYTFDQEEPYKEAANYVARLLNGERASDLPVQTPTKYDLVINLKTAKALGITVPLIMQMAADEVIE